MKTDRQALEEAIELIDNPEHWTQGTYARDRKGKPVPSAFPEAQQRCTVGALIKTCEDDRQVGRIGSMLQGAIGECITEFNDTHSHSDVILALKRGLDLMDE